MDITRFRGDTKPFKVLLSDASGPLDLTGCVVVLTTNTKASPVDSSTQVFQLTGSATAPATGVVEFSLNSTQADNVGYFYFDIQITDAQGKIFTVSNGMFVFKQDITK